MIFLRQLWALTWKDLRLLAADRTAIVTLFVLPALFLFVMSLALSGLYSRTRAPGIAIVNLDRGPVASQIAGRLERNGSLRLVPVRDQSIAEEALYRGEVLAALVVGPDFSAAVDRQAQGARTPLPIKMVVDPSAPVQVVAPLRGAIRGAVERTIAEVVLPVQLRSRVRSALRESDDPTALLPLVDAFEGLKVEEVEVPLTLARSGDTPETPPTSLQQNVPAWTIFGIFFIVNSLALSLLREQAQGTLARLGAAPLSPILLLLGKLLPFYLVNLVQAALMFTLGRFVLGLEPGGPWPGLVAVTLATALVATSLGLLVATCFDSPEQLGGIASVLVVVLAAVGGILVPSFVMPDFLRRLALFTPQHWALVGYQDVLLRGEGLEGVLVEVGALLLFATVLFTLALWRLKSRLAI